MEELIQDINEEAKKEIRRLVKAGVVGIKLHPVVECFRPDHPFFFEIYEEIVNYGMFIISHSMIKMILEMYDRFFKLTTKFFQKDNS